MTAAHLLRLPDLVERFGWSRSRIMRMVRAGTFPAPMNAEQASDYRWHQAVVEAYELGEWRAPATEPGLRAVS
jgi:predicted DNA-binding transcriptional regulator AlpA